MKVLKFGGTSVGYSDSILLVKKIVESQQEQVVVVVSAVGGITDELIKSAHLAETSIFCSVLISYFFIRFFDDLK